MGSAIHLLAAVLIGAALSLQPPINAAMARTLGSPSLSATISIAISLALAVLLWWTWGKGTGEWSQLRLLPWWVALGGVIGVVFVAGSLTLAPALGVALFFVCVVAGQLLGSTAIDQIGAFGAEVRPVNWMKVLGLGLVLVGALLVRSSDG